MLIYRDINVVYFTVTYMFWSNGDLNV